MHKTLCQTPAGDEGGGADARLSNRGIDPKAPTSLRILHASSYRMLKTSKYANETAHGDRLTSRVLNHRTTPPSRRGSASQQQFYEITPSICTLPFVDPFEGLPARNAPQRGPATATCRAGKSSGRWPPPMTQPAAGQFCQDAEPSWAPAP